MPLRRRAGGLSLRTSFPNGAHFSAALGSPAKITILRSSVNTTKQSFNNMFKGGLIFAAFEQGVAGLGWRLEAQTFSCAWRSATVVCNYYPLWGLKPVNNTHFGA